MDASASSRSSSACLALSPCVSQREGASSFGQREGGAQDSSNRSSTNAKGLPARPAGVGAVPRETILSKVKEAGQYLPASRLAAVSSSASTTTSAHTPVPQGYTVNSEGRLVFPRLKDEVKFATTTAAVRSVLEHHQGLLRSLGIGGGGGAKDSNGARSFVALVCKDAAKAGSYRLCMRYFGSRLPAAVPWAIDALMRGETLSHGIQEVLQIGGRRAVLGMVGSALPIGGLPSFLLIGAGWWAVEKGARSLVGMFADDGQSSQDGVSGGHQKKDKTAKKRKAKL